MVGDQLIETKSDPILKDEFGWLTSPEYFAPEIINSLIDGVYTDIWASETSP